MQNTATKPAEKKEINKSSFTKNVVQFRSNFINLQNSGEDNRGLAMSILSELLQFGYVLTPDAIDNIAAASKKDIIDFHNEVISYLKKMTGSNRNHKAFWPGFPEQVMEKSEFELWIHQIVHYMSNGSYAPSEWTKERPTAFEQSKYYNITSGDESKFEKIFSDLVSVNNSLTPDDLEVVKWFVISGSVLRFPEQIPFKENLCTLAAMGLDVPVKTVTDVLRISVGMSGGDISLPKVPYKLVKTNRWSTAKSNNPARELFKFKKFSRAERRIVLGLLEKTNCDVTEAILKDQRWIRLGEILHPGEYQAKYPKAFKMFDSIRNNKVQSWYGKVNSAFKKSPEEGIKMLSQRPGEFMRKLDWLVRGKSETRTAALIALSEIAPKVSNKVLFECFTHFEGRYVANSNRTIMIKGKRNRTKLPDLISLPPNVITTIQGVIKEALLAKFSALPKIGKAFVDEKLQNIPLPANMRSASSGLRPRIRGQRIPIGNQNAKVIRAFVHWFDDHGNQDIDLTCTFIGLGKIEHIGWNGKHNSDSLGCYSGDIRHRQGACAEYIDIKIASALKMGYKYAIIDARNYNGGSFESIKDCVAGYMEREHAKANEIFVPSTIANCTRLTNKSSSTIVSMIDLETQEFIHLDIDQDGLPVASANFNELIEAVKPYMEKPAFSVYDLVLMHVEGRGGELVEVNAKADVYYTFHEFSESYLETMKLMGV